MKCCLVHYLKGVRAYQRRIRELKEQVDILEDSAAAARAEMNVESLRAFKWKASAKKWRSTAEHADAEWTIAHVTANELREEIERLQKRCRELEERDREERGVCAATVLPAGRPADPWEGGAE